MSGGAFDYQNYRLDDISQEIQHRLAHRKKKDEDGWTYNLDPQAATRLRFLQKILKILSDTLYSADYLLCGDYGTDEFVKDFDRDLKKIKKLSGNLKIK